VESLPSKQIIFGVCATGHSSPVFQTIDAHKKAFQMACQKGILFVKRLELIEKWVFKRMERIEGNRSAWRR
jgi:hypothetical protein